MTGDIPEDKLHQNYRTVVMGWHNGLCIDINTSIALITEKALAEYNYTPKRWWEFWRVPSVTYTCFPHDLGKEDEFFRV